MSIVVLPFANLSDDRDQQYFADGVTEDLTTDLSRIAHMLVISRNTAFTYKNKPVNAKQIGRDLGVRYVLERSVQRSGNQVRVNAQLIDAETDAHLWAERFDRDMGDLFALQNEITGRIANTLNVAADTRMPFPNLRPRSRSIETRSADYRVLAGASSTPGRWTRRFRSRSKPFAFSPRDPNIGFRHLLIGTVHLLQSHTDEAIVWFEKGCSGMPAEPQLHSGLAAAYALKGESDRAAAELAEARRLHGGDRWSSITNMKAFAGGWGAMSPKIRALSEATYFAGLRKAGMPEE